MELHYICTGTDDMNPKRWEGCIRLLKNSVPYELEVTARHSSFHILCGKHEYGNYICYPNRNKIQTFCRIPYTHLIVKEFKFGFY